MSLRRPALIVFFVALALRLPFAFIAPATSLKTPITSDFTEDAVAYVNVARSLVEHDVYGFGGRASAFRPPLYPWMIAAVFEFFPENFMIVRLLQAVIGALACLFLLRLTARLYDPTTAFWAGLAFGFYPMFLYFTGEMMTETQYFAVSLAAVWLTVRADQLGSRGSWILAGATWGLAILCRPTALYFVFALAAIAAVLFWRGQRKRALVLAGVVAVGVATMTPWVIRNSLLFGELVPITTYSGINLYKGLPNKDNRSAVGDLGYNHHLIEDPDQKDLPENELLLDRRASAYWKQFVAEHPGAYVREKLYDLYRFWFDFNLAGNLRGTRLLMALATFGPYLMALLLGLYGIVCAWRNGHRLAALVVITMLVVTMAAYVPFYAGKRYRMPTVDPYLVMSASYVAYQWVQLRFRRRSGDRVG
jgi:4-amino-4-deoxy-L-arabinose transferase-like glycosyltransferase